MGPDDYEDVKLKNGIVLRAISHQPGMYGITYPPLNLVYSIGRGWVSNWRDENDRLDSWEHLSIQAARCDQLQIPMRRNYPLPVIQYVHHEQQVYVRQDLKGKHREYCLCHSCANFHPEKRENNCHIANALFEVDVKFGVVTPVWECPMFIQRETDSSVV